MSKFKFLTIFAILMLTLAACGGTAEEAEPEVVEVTRVVTETISEEVEVTRVVEGESITETVTEEVEVTRIVEVPAEEAEAAEEAVLSLSVGELKDIPREDTVAVAWSMTSPIGVTNPWAVPGYTHQEFNNMLWEGLSYFQIFADKELPWLAESMEYTNDDFTELTIKVNPLAKWSDGVPVTSKDVVYTFEGQLADETLPYHASFVQFVESIETVDDHTVVVTFNQPAPRFKFEVLTLKFDTGIPIVPAHVLEPLDDYNEFQGGLEMPHSGPYSYVSW